MLIVVLLTASRIQHNFNHLRSSGNEEQIKFKKSGVQSSRVGCALDCDANTFVRFPRLSFLSLQQSFFFSFFSCFSFLFLSGHYIQYHLLSSTRVSS